MRYVFFSQAKRATTTTHVYMFFEKGLSELIGQPAPRSILDPNVVIAFGSRFKADAQQGAIRVEDRRIRPLEKPALSKGRLERASITVAFLF
jgi:hypothetical protein